MGGRWELDLGGKFHMRDIPDAEDGDATQPPALFKELVPHNHLSLEAACNMYGIPCLFSWRVQFFK